MADAISRTVQVARHAEKEGYRRIWLAEHHNMPHVASSATAVLIGHVAQSTSRIRVGAGGIMLPNHSPLMVAEEFGTLETLFPSRIDLGLGRAPGTDQLTAMALRRNHALLPYDFAAAVRELKGYLGPPQLSQQVRAFPGEGTEVPLWILGSSTDSAYLAASMGLPYVFASHFAPGLLMESLSIYRSNFRPSLVWEKPYTMVCANVVAAETDEEADYLASSIYQSFLGILTNDRKPLRPPFLHFWDHLTDPQLKQALEHMTACTFTGGKEGLQERLGRFLELTEADELMVTCNVFDMGAKLRSYSLLKEVMGDADDNPFSI